ncbi:unnamed protein product, partial [marine sediment metagenome]
FALVPIHFSDSRLKSAESVPRPTPYDVPRVRAECKHVRGGPIAMRPVAMKFDITPAPRRRQPILLERLEGRLLFDAVQLDPFVNTIRPATSPLVSDVAHAIDLADGSQDAAPQAALSAAAVDHVADNDDRILAFPGASGMGAYAQGGRGGDVYHVTSLDDYGTGTLRDGIDSATGPRTIVFDISGTIESAV